MHSHLFTIAACIWLLSIYVGMAYLENQADRRSEHIKALQIEQWHKAKEFAAKRNEIARSICGNAHYEWLGAKTIQCTPRRSGKPYVVKL